MEQFMEQFKVITERDGQDCDGSISHRETEETLSYPELTARLGEAVLRHGGNCTTLETDLLGVTLVFSSRHDEGFSRTIIYFREL